MVRYAGWGFVAVVILGVIAVAFYLNSGAAVQTAVVKTESIREFVDLQAKTRLPRTYVISMPYAARLDELKVEEGDTVTHGEVVCQVVQNDLENEVNEVQAVVDRLAKSIAESQDVSVESSAYQQAISFVESMGKTVEAADAQKASGKASLDYAQAYLDRLKKLTSTGATTQNDLDQGEMQFIESQSGYRQDNLIAEAIRAIEAATKLLPQMVQDYIGRKGLGTQVLVKQKDEAEARLRQALIRKQRGTMTSPVDGVVLSRAIVNEQYVAAGTELLTIGNLHEMEVEADVLSEEIVKARIGNEVEVYGTALGMSPGAGIRARVSRVFPAGFTKVSSLGVEQQRVKAIIQLDDSARQSLLDRNVGVGYRLRVRIYTSTAANAIVVPRSSLFRGPENQWQLFAIDGRTARLTDVEVGLMNDDHVQIKSGLSKFDSVIVAPDKSISHGTRVKPIDKAVLRPVAQE